MVVFFLPYEKYFFVKVEKFFLRTFSGLYNGRLYGTVRPGTETLPPAHLHIGPVDHLNELPTLEHEQEILIALQQSRIQTAGLVDRLAHPARQHQLQYLCKNQNKKKHPMKRFRCANGDISYFVYFL